jgi:hypothetical protein
MTVRCFLKEIGRDCRQFINSITFDLYGILEDRNRAAELLYLCPNLRKLEICMVLWSMDWKTKNMLQAHGISRLRGVRGCEEVKLTSSFRNNYPRPPWTKGLEDFSKVLKEELCSERSPHDKLRPEKLAEEQMKKAGKKAEQKKLGQKWESALRARKLA